MSALLEAALGLHVEVCRLFIQHGADPNVMDEVRGSLVEILHRPTRAIPFCRLLPFAAVWPTSKPGVSAVPYCRLLPFGRPASLE